MTRAECQIDDRQLAVAKTTGMAVIDIKRRVQRVKR
jgi:hypothetical protein